MRSGVICLICSGVCAFGIAAFRAALRVWNAAHRIRFQPIRPVGLTLRRRLCIYHARRGQQQGESLRKSNFHAPASISLRLGVVCYGFLGIAPGPNRSDRSSPFTASARNGPTRKISCIVRKSEECVRFNGLAYGTPFTFL